jgi:hypothetical protein
MLERTPKERASQASAEKPAEAPAGRAVDTREHAKGLAARLGAAAGGTVSAVILYGSHLLGANPDRHSALDFVLVVRDYRAFYRALRASGEIHRPTWLMAGLSRVLPPNVIAFTPEEGEAGLAKCLVIDHDDFERALGPAPRDHFLVARMVQRVALVLASDDERARWVEAQLHAAHVGALAWVGPFLDEPFDAEALGRRLLEISYRAEFRPEARNRADTIFATQRAHFREVFAPIFDAEADAGRLVRVGDAYRFANPPGEAVRRRWMRHLRWSKARVTARWLKHVLTFDNWLPYIARKVERRTGTRVELTTLERRAPLIFLWPRVFRVLLTRPEGEHRE